MSSRIGILGGTFNPIHYGHLAAAEEVRDRLKLDRILFIPSAIPPHKHEEDVPAAEHRMEMVRLALEGNSCFEPSDLEIRRGGRSYTIDTIETLIQSYPDAALFFITGLDSFLEIQTWNRWDRLVTLVQLRRALTARLPLQRPREDRFHGARRGRTIRTRQRPSVTMGFTVGRDKRLSGNDSLVRYFLN